MLAQSVAAMTINCSCVLAGHGRSITSESSVTPLFIQQTIERRPAFAKVYVCFSRIKKMLGRIETQTRDRIYCQTIRTVICTTCCIRLCYYCVCGLRCIVSSNCIFFNVFICAYIYLSMNLLYVNIYLLIYLLIY